MITLNDVAYVEAARAMAQRVLHEGGVDDVARVAYALPSDCPPAIRRGSGRAATAHPAIARHLRCQTEAAQELLKVGEHVRDETLTVTDHAAYTVLRNLLFNLDEVITRE